MTGTATRTLRATALFARKAERLPVFCHNDIAWLVAESVTNMHAGQLAQEIALPIGLTVSMADDGAWPDVLCLAHGTRVVLVQLLDFAREEPAAIFLEKEEQAGFDLLCELLLCSAGKDAQPMRNMSSANVSLSLISLNGSELVYLFRKWFDVHASMIDLELFAKTMGIQNFYPFDPWAICYAVLGVAEQSRLKVLDEAWCTLYRKDERLDSAYLVDIIKSIRLSIASFKAAEMLLTECRQSSQNSHKDIATCIVDTRNVPMELIDSMALFTNVETCLHHSKPKESKTHLRNIDNVTEKGGGGNVLAKAVDNKELRRFFVQNEQFKTRIMRSSRQLHEVTFDVDGEEKTFRARAVDSTGKQSTLEFYGDEAAEAMRYLRLNDEEGDQEDGGGHRPKAVLRRIFVKGREDHTRADIMRMTWRRSLLREGTKIKQQELLLHLLFGSPIREPDLRKAGLLEAQSVALMEKPWLDGFSIIEEKEASKKLNESQARAARAILSPLVPKPFGKAAGAESTNNPVSSRCPADRLILVHGPPGTGKTSLITACCQQFVQATEIDVMLPAGVQLEPKKEMFKSLDTIYACCQSNVAVKNIGESLSRNGVDFRIVVSPNFYVEWHEDLYDDIKGRLITTDNLPVGVEALSKHFAGCQVILSTLAFLSGQKFAVDNPLRKLRPMRLLMVDEASQIHIRQYPHLLDAYGHQLARIVFFGDDRQLAPFSSESSSELGISVFELDHLRPKAFMLDTCYRLPKPMVEFISDKVYDGKVRVGPSNFNPQGGLSDCVAFIDVKSSQECREGKSRKNAAEVAVVLALLTSYKEAGGDMKVVKVLTIYDAQREALQRTLKHAGLSGDADLVFSVDAFQGHECDHVILSLVRDGRPTIYNFRRSAPMIVKPNLGFLSNERRTNVALTRARRSLTIVSTRAFIEDVGSDTLAGKLQVALQFAQADPDVEHWLEEHDILRGALPAHLKVTYK